MAERLAIRIKFADEERPRWARVTREGVYLTPGEKPPLECTHALSETARAERDLASVMPQAGMESGPELVRVDVSAQIEERISALRETIAQYERELGR